MRGRLSTLRWARPAAAKGERKQRDVPSRRPEVDTSVSARRPCSAAPWERRGVLDSNLSGTPRPTERRSPAAPGSPCARGACAPHGSRSLAASAQCLLRLPDPRRPRKAGALIAASLRSFTAALHKRNLQRNEAEDATRALRAPRPSAATSPGSTQAGGAGEQAPGADPRGRSRSSAETQRTTVTGPGTSRRGANPRRLDTRVLGFTAII